MDHYKVRCRKAILAKQPKLAEGILLELNKVDEAVELYQGLHKWEDAVALAESRAHPDLDTLKKNYLQWLLTTGQQGKAAEVNIKGQSAKKERCILMKYSLKTLDFASVFGIYHVYTS